MDVFQVREIDGGPLVGLTFDGEVWRFQFANEFAVDSLAGWRLFEAAREPGSRTILGSRDIQDAINPFAELYRELSGFELKFLHFYQMKETFELILMRQDLERTVSIQLHCTSAHNENWRLIGEDFVDSDRTNLMQDLNSGAEGMSRNADPSS